MKLKNEIYIIILACNEGGIIARQMLGTREEVKAKLAEMIDEAAEDDEGNPGIRDIYDNLLYPDGGFSGSMDFADFSIEYFAYPMNEILITGFSADADQIMDAQTIVNTGTIQTDSFSLTGFDEDEGFWERTVPAGTYEFRILDVRGWRPHQLLVDGKWIDIAGNEELIEAIQKQIWESGVEV